MAVRYNAIPRLLGLLLLTSLLGACSTTFRGSPEPVTDRAADLAALQRTLTSAAIAACLDKPDEACRGRIVRSRKAAEDIRYFEFEERVFREGRTVGFFATLSTLGLTTASAATSGGAAKATAGLAALITGTRESYEKEVLAEKTLQALMTAMRGNRANMELRIRNGLARPATVYPLEDALGDLEAYRRAGTLQGALDTVTESASTKTQEAEKNLGTLREDISFRLDNAAQRLKLVICGSDSNCMRLNDAEVARMKRDCWPKAKVPEGTLIVDFMLQEAFANKRSEVSDCLVPAKTTP